MNRTITHILVSTDLSAASDAAVEYGMAMARRFGASLHLLHVIDERLTSIPALRRMLVDEAAVNLSVLLKRAERRRIPARGEVRLGSPGDVIRDFANEEAFDLIVMGTPGPAGMRHVPSVRVAERMVRHAPCPVLTVRSDVAEPITTEHKLFEREPVPADRFASSHRCP